VKEEYFPTLAAVSRVAHRTCFLCLRLFPRFARVAQKWHTYKAMYAPPTRVSLGSQRPHWIDGRCTPGGQQGGCSDHADEQYGYGDVGRGIEGSDPEEHMP